ncbi:MAG: beta/gamma crystallin-related protein [Candidatus Poribacteria bacterium]|nr:beta/gamma crystallin-related protein [Candidatus Poribacteria bacterium]
MPSNPRLIVELFRDKYFLGTRQTVVEPIENMASIGMNDVVSSMKIYHGPGSMVSPNQRALFYEGANFSGRRMVLSPGYYPDIHAIPYNFGDMIASLSFSPSAPLTAPQYGWIPLVVEVFQDLNYKGRMGTLLRDVSYFGEIGLNDSISSLRVTRGPNFPYSGCRVIFYQHPDYEGRELIVPLTMRDFTVEIPNLHEHPQHFGDIISSCKILPTGSFNVLIVEGDRRTREVGMLGDFATHEGNKFEFTHIKINRNLDNYGSSDATDFTTIIPRLSEFDIIWFTWNAAGHDYEYFFKPNEERAIKDWVKEGGVLWASAMDNLIIAEGEERGNWRGDWLPVERHPARVVNSTDVKIWMTREGRKTGLFTWPQKIDLTGIETDDHWVTTDPSYTILARRDDNQEPVAAELPWGAGKYVLFAIDTRSDDAAERAKHVIGNALCYLSRGRVRRDNRCGAVNDEQDSG